MKGRERFVKIVFFLFMIVPAAWSSAAFGAPLTLRVPAPYPTVQAAIEAAHEGDTILVADGIYSVPVNEGLVVAKPIRILHEGDPKDCIIDCEGNGRAFTFVSGATSATLLSGFTIIGGNVAGIQPQDTQHNSGGGILCEGGATPTIENCIIGFISEEDIPYGNSAKYGGGIACISSSPVISSCRIEGNNAANVGGGLYIVDSSPKIMGSTISDNEAGTWGGAVYIVTSQASASVPSRPSIASCMITGNAANTNGGAVYCTGSSPLITNTTVADNRAGGSGGGLYVKGNSNPIVANAIFWGNSAPASPEIYVNPVSTLNINYSIVKGEEAAALKMSAGAPPLDNTIQNVDPGFVDPAAGDYHLRPDSPCRDAGTKEGVTLPEYDIDGDLRSSGSNPDIGADEIRYQVVIDVRPGSHRERIDLKAWGFLPVAVLSTEDFDATSIDPKTVEFAGAKPKHALRTHVNRDRRADMLFFFWIRDLDLGVDEDSTAATMTTEVALFADSAKKGSIVGTDTVTIINPKHKRHWWSRFEEFLHRKAQGHFK